MAVGNGFEQAGFFALPPVVRQRRPEHPLDLIFCQSDPGLCAMLALNAGWKLGTRSHHGALGRWQKVEQLVTQRNARLTFIDNEWHGYVHDEHVEMVSYFKPKYATVRDYVSESQAKDAGVEYMPLDLVLEHAREVSQYAENVIVIPKVDVLDDIPEQYVLGYSVPTSYGATPLPLEHFRGRRVHLLGGSWRQQRAMLGVLQEDVVSVDCNQHLLLAFKGSFIMPEGDVQSLWEALGVRPTNTWAAALSLSLGNIAREVSGFSMLPRVTFDEELAKEGLDGA